MCSLIGVAFSELYVRLWLDGIWTDWKNPCGHPNYYQKYEARRLVIGAGGAGLRAAHRASAAGGRSSVGPGVQVPRGKAHTSWRRGAFAAALANVDGTDKLERVHFAGTMRPAAST